MARKAIVKAAVKKAVAKSAPVGTPDPGREKSTGYGIPRRDALSDQRYGAASEATQLLFSRLAMQWDAGECMHVIDQLKKSVPPTEKRLTEKDFFEFKLVDLVDIRVANILENAGYLTVGQVLGNSREALLLEVRMLGGKSVDHLIERIRWLKERITS